LTWIKETGHKTIREDRLWRIHLLLNDRENILSALREKAMKVREIMKRANIANEEVCQSLLLKMRDEGLVKFDIHSGRWLIG
jgi:DNA-binding IclR family transcriptional regulator